MISLTIIFVALRLVFPHRRAFRVAIGFGLASAVSVVIAAVHPTPTALGIEALLAIAILGFVGAVILADIARTRTVTMDTIFGAACVYLLLGLFWGSLYRLVLWADPGAFRFPSFATTGAGLESVPGWITYFSLVTLATVGYGDVTPASPLARSLAAIEGMTGQLYVAIMIARLVALQVKHGTDRPSADV